MKAIIVVSDKRLLRKLIIPVHSSSVMKRIRSRGLNGGHSSWNPSSEGPSLGASVMAVSMESSEKAAEFGDDGREWRESLDRSWTNR